MFTILFWFLIIFSLFRFVFGFVIPLLATTRQLRGKMKDMQQNTQNYQTNTSSDFGSNTSSKGQKRSASGKGDYIDFEEVK
jgi:hypothetical protein